MEDQVLTIPQEPEETNLKERTIPFVHAILLLIVAYTYMTVLFAVFQDNSYPALLFIGNTALFVLTFVFGMISGGKVNAVSILSLLFGLVSGANAWINGLNFLPVYIYFHVMILSYTFLALSMFGNHNRTLNGGMLFLDAVKATFIYPFASFSALFTTLFRPSKGSKKFGKAVLLTVLGVVIAFFLCLISIALLSYDPAFREIFTFDFDWDDVPLTIIKILFTVPLAALLLGAFVSSKAHKAERMSSPEAAVSFTERIKKIPAVVLMIPIVSLLVIYGIFFFTQWGTYTAAFSGILPSDFTAAEYARSGFFELCGVAFINAVLGIVMGLFMKQADRASVLLRKLANSLLAIATLVLIATALSKMILYVQRFDLTVLRLFVSVVLVLIAVGFLTSLLSQWIKPIKVTPVLVVLVGLLLLVTPFLNVRGRIAKYNVDAYLARAEQGILSNKIDTGYLVSDLGSAAIPDAVRLLESGKLRPAYETRLEEQLAEHAEYLKNHNTFLEQSLFDRRALNCLLNSSLYRPAASGIEIKSATLNSFEVQGDTVVFTCEVEIINTSKEIQSFQLIGLFQPDQQNGLIQENELVAQDSETHSTVLTANAESNQRIIVVFLGTFAGNPEKQNRNAPEILVSYKDSNA